MNTDPQAVEQGCLHLLFSQATDTLKACISHCQPGDSLILLNTAVILLLDESWNEAMEAGVTVYTLQADVGAHGLSEGAAGSHCKMISDSGWAELVMHYPLCLSWK